MNNSTSNAFIFSIFVCHTEGFLNATLRAPEQESLAPLAYPAYAKADISSRYLCTGRHAPFDMYTHTHTHMYTNARTCARAYTLTPSFSLALSLALPSALSLALSLAVSLALSPFKHAPIFLCGDDTVSEGRGRRACGLDPDTLRTVCLSI